VASIRQYVLSVICAAMICAILLDLADKCGFRKQIQLVCSIFVACTLLSPLVRFEIPTLAGLGSDYRELAHSAAAQGETIRIQSVAAIIRQETEAYILKEAKSIGADVEVDVQLDYGDPPKPTDVTLRGTFDADAEIQLSRFLADELGIQKEHQTWIRQERHSYGNS